MVKPSVDAPFWKHLSCFILFTLVLSWRQWRGLVLQTASHATLKRPTFSAAGDIAENGRQMSLHEHPHPALLSNQRLTAVLPVSNVSIHQIADILAPLLDPGTAVREVILLAPASLHRILSDKLRQELTKHEGQDHPEIGVKTWDDDISPSVFRLLRASPWTLVMRHDGLLGVDKQTRSILVGEIIDWSLPYGPRGIPLPPNGTHPANIVDWVHLPRSQPDLALYIEPPFVIRLDTLSNLNPLPSTWKHFSEQIALCNPWNASGLLVGRHGPPEISPSPLSLATNVPQASSIQTNVSRNVPATTPPAVLPHQRLRFDVLLSEKQDVQNLAPFLCGLLSRGHTIRVLVVDTNLQFSFNPIKRKTRLVMEGGCSVDFFTINQYMRRREIFRSIGDDGNYGLASHVVITLKSHNFAGFLLDTFRFADNIIVEVPQQDLAYCDWMASLTLQQWKNWHKPRIDISVITRDRPNSLARLLGSLSAARYFGDSIDLRLNVEQDCDFETLKISQTYSWPHGSFFLHHRIVHGGLLPAIVESWYPRNNDTYGLLLEDDVELSPLFYAWVKMAILKYRYDSPIDQSPNLFGVSLYQQKHVELRPEGRIPFNARSLFSSQGLPFPSTPYLSQVPCSWGAVYFPEHWSLFHDYLLLRFSESWLSMGDTVVPHVRSNNWLRSWKKFFIELAYLKGYVMLYPNYENYLSLSTNHLEYGSHVRSRTKEKQDLFEVPLLPLPRNDDDADAMGKPTRLLELPDMNLPRYRDLPILNLTASLTTEDDLMQAQDRRRAQLCALHWQRNNTTTPSLSGPGSSGNVHDSIRNFICGDAD
ncbi:hypothetical protein EST38_g9232 [Candolleomyces aberdarensis]|uniref:Uncharacterized protein n=1 Tax=Candolleomyces aberdarensis TaxID=2316362 RepID=A0A4Q2DCM9_9AGAR|nr:hypothetical protein EST38_g9232 [Candolleomyces aberdarensis]